MSKPLGPIAVSTAFAMLLSFAACERNDTQQVATVEEPVAAPEPEVTVPERKGRAPNPLRNLYWGDTHLHTSYSPDAFFLANQSNPPDVAYRYAKGLPVVHAYTKTRVQIGTPLDFLVVADHAEYVTVPLRLKEKEPALLNTKFGKRLSGLMESGQGQQAAYEIIGSINDNDPYDAFVTDEVRSTAWDLIVDAAERHNDPGKFTALIGWEWTSMGPGGADNLHRVIFMPEDRTVAEQFLPYSAFDSINPEDLWRWLEKTSEETGADFVAIAHNGNVSNGLMFSRLSFDGKPLSAGLAKMRARWEPVYEVTQIKGDSETHPILSPDDEFADFETYAHALDAAAAAKGGEVAVTVKEGDYARRALRTGLELENDLRVNPFKFGLIGSTDSHTSLASAEEDNFWGKFVIDSTPESRRDNPTMPGVDNMWAVSASGLAAVWAEENTRESLVEAFKRKEVYGTSGPRIGLRFFGGFEFDDSDANVQNLAEVGYDKGIPMGGDLSGSTNGRAPSFLIHAVKGPVDANLDRVQVVKGWLDGNGETREKVYDVAWSGDRKVGADGTLPPVGNTVNLETGAYTNGIGAAELTTVWSDPDFDPDRRAFYYVRVLQIPTPRYSLLDAIALQMDYRETGHPATIQERAYSSPIWYTPEETTP